MGPFVLRLTVVAVCGLAATWLGAGTDEVCPAVYPAPASCGVGARTAPAAVGTGVVAALLVLSIVLVALRDGRAVRALTATILGLGCVVAPVWTLLATGFPADERILLVALLVLVVVVVVVGTVRAPRSAQGERR